MQPVSPRIVTRIVPGDGSLGISAKSLSETAAATQAIASYAGNDVCQGFNPDFADLRSLSPEVQQLTRLTVEPFEPGSFVIPNVFETYSVEVQTADANKVVTAQEVAARFAEIMNSFVQPHARPAVSIGVIQAIEALSPMLRRERAVVEFNGHDALGTPFQTVLVNAEYIANVRLAKEARQSTFGAVEELEGVVTALDIRKYTLQLNVPNQKSRVRGAFPPLYLQSLLESLGQRVRLKGYITWKEDLPVSINVFSVVLLDQQ